MSKISLLSAAAAITGEESLPIVQDKVSKRVKLAVLMTAITKLLPNWYKGDKGEDARLPQRRDFVATEGQTQFPSAAEFVAQGFLDNKGEPFDYDPLTARVELSGIGLTPGIDFTAGVGQPFVLTVPVPAGKVLTVSSYVAGLNSNNVITLASSMNALKAVMPISAVVAVPHVGSFEWTPGDFTGLDDDRIVVKANLFPLTAGAWVRQGIGTLLPLGYRADGTQDDGPQLQALIDAGSYLLAKRKLPYRVGQQLFLPNQERRILHQPNLVFQWLGDTSAFSGLYVCRYTSAPIVIGVNGGEHDRWFVNATPPAAVNGVAPKHLFYPVLILSAANVSFNGCTTNGILGIVGPGESRLYSTVKNATAGTYVGPGVAGDNRLCTNIHFENCDGGFAQYTDANEFLYFNFTDGFSARNITARNVTQGIVWWGGDAQGIEGAIGTARLCRNGVISNCLVDGAGGAGIWGSMGQRIRVRDSEIRYCGDVGFDAEGCVDVEFSGCTADNAVNGTFTTYYANVNVRFVNPTSYQDIPGARHVATWTAGDENRDCVVDGGHYENRSGIGSFGTDPARVSNFIVRGAVYLVNVIYKAFAQGPSTTDAADIYILLTTACPAPAVMVGNNETTQPSVLLDNIRIRDSYGQAAGWIAIQIHDGGNAPFMCTVRNVTVRSTLADGSDPVIVGRSYNKNGGASSNFIFIGVVGVKSITVTQTNGVPVHVGGGLNFNSQAQPVTPTLVPYVAA